ncbi:zeta toxin family protein [Streptomyces sp. NBC_01336]|uniref:zeta toxin family protein n=1 Tax=Streptomyces sp. NBC_01336 TaxID=2903829 RepID=UPI003FCC2EFF
MAQLVAEALDARGGFVDVDSDLYKPYHPQYAQLMAEDDRLMTLYTGHDGRVWMRQAQQFVRGEDPLSGGEKLNALVQEIAMDPQFLAETMQKYRDVGTRIETLVLAVSQPMSEQGILNRYHEQVLDRGQGRLTVPEKAQASYTGIADSCEVIVREGLADFAADAAELARAPPSRCRRAGTQPALDKGRIPGLRRCSEEAARGSARRVRPPARPYRPAGRPAWRCRSRVPRASRRPPPARAAPPPPSRRRWRPARTRHDRTVRRHNTAQARNRDPAREVGQASHPDRATTPAPADVPRRIVQRGLHPLFSPLKR